jgi:S-adenosylhomocysteine hydrolase
MSKQQILKIVISVLIAALTALGAAIGLNSCNVVRTITNKSEFYQRGDTSVMIQTKTTESYDARKNLY